MDSAKQILNMCYPIDQEINKKNIQKMYGKVGLLGTQKNQYKDGIMYKKR